MMCGVRAERHALIAADEVVAPAAAMSRVCVVTDTEADVDKRVAEAWARVEAGLGRVLTASLGQLNAPAAVQAIDAAEAALAVPLPQDFRASLRIHNGTGPGPTLPSPDPSPVPLECLYDTNLIIERTRMWRDSYQPEPNWDDPQVWAYMVDRNMLWLNGPVRPIIGSPGTVVVGDMNGDVQWLLDFDPAPGGTPGQVVRVDVECSSWDVLAPSWTQLLVRYAEDLELFAADPDNSTLEIDDLGPACEWGASTPSDSLGVRPAWLLDVQARDPYPYHRAESEAYAMRWRNERNERCTLDGEHKPHVFRSTGRHNPCGGGQASVDKDADRRRWDHP
jgi:cell wall assembly regulator SMI1